MQSDFEISLVGELKLFLGFQIKEMIDQIFLSQVKYAKNLVKKFGLDNATSAWTPISITLKLLPDSSNKNVETMFHRSVIGSLLNPTASYPNISLSVGVYAMYQVHPNETHLNAVKRIIKYVKGMLKVGIWYHSDTTIELVNYSIVNWAGCNDDRKVLHVVVSTYEISWPLGTIKKRAQYIFPLRMLNIILIVCASLNYFGWNICYLIMVSKLKILPYIVKTPVLFLFQRIHPTLMDTPFYKRPCWIKHLNCTTYMHWSSTCWYFH